MDPNGWNITWTGLQSRHNGAWFLNELRKWYEKNPER